ncbi:putative DNA gyrase subunit A, chloroplastic/mitochondrial-like isoform X1 [Capsicum annuum]|uniref:uncharacterized protein LOC107839386 isoform X1 n=1 Tax=Capsicum annuum TaxID=4072 RepID=UPI001FB070A3|nr:uncharacterized protein LOC107839386 isoform X1 [Capsicum annuum]KAF3612618.1 putative DNA gyrase subunit A, chloroplastic/mitochondrial-like isoform X1 [Capsicum annuum]
MATSAFKSTSRRGTANSNSSSSSSKAPPLVRKRSLSVSAISRTSTKIDFDSKFSNKCDNPLFCTENDKGKINEKENFGVARRSDIVEERGRTVTRGSGVKNGIGRSVSRVRGRSVSRGHYGSAYESEKELQSNNVQRLTSGKVANTSKNSSLVRNDTDRSSQAKISPGTMRQGQVTEYSEDDSASSLHISNWEDSVSACSLSEAEEKTIKAVCEQMKSVRSDQWGADTAASGIYETVRSEVRRAISDIQTDLEDAIRRNNVNAITTANVADIPPNLVNPEADELVSDIRREYARKLDESEERARKLRSDLAVEEHRGLEISRILKEILSDPKPSPPQRSRAGRKRSNERKKMSKRLTEEALTYFDECVSISTFDSSDFSAPEYPSHSSAVATSSTGVTAPVLLGSPSTMSTSSLIIAGHIQHTDGYEDSSLTANSYNDEPLLHQVEQKGSDPVRGQQIQFSFGQKSPESNQTHEDLRSYVKHFEKDTNKDVFSLDTNSLFYDANEYKLQGHTESLLFGRVALRNRIASGGLHLCSGGFPVTCFPFGFA